VAGNGKTQALGDATSRQGRPIKGISRRRRRRVRASATFRDLPERAAESRRRTRRRSGHGSGSRREGFRPLYIVDPDTKKGSRELKKLLKNADELLLATDDDAKARLLAWHLLEVPQAGRSGAANGFPRDYEGPRSTVARRERDTTSA